MINKQFLDALYKLRSDAEDEVMLAQHYLDEWQKAQDAPQPTTTKKSKEEYTKEIEAGRNLKNTLHNKRAIVNSRDNLITDYINLHQVKN